MEIENTPLYREALAIIANGQTSSNVSWRALIHYGESGVYAPFQLISVNTIRDYAASFADETTVSMRVPLGTYAHKIYPNRLAIQITLTKITLDETTGEPTDSQLESERYTAFLIDGPKAPTVGQGSESNDEESLNLSQILDIHFQIYDKSVEQLRVMLCGGVIRGSTAENAVRSLLTSRSTEIVVDGERAIEGVAMVTADNKDLHKQITIAHATRLVDAVDLIQAKFGIYNSGVGNYIQDKYWHVYPLFDTSKFSTRLKTVTILVLPKRKFSHIERTYKVEGDSLTIIITDETSFKDDSGQFYANHGNGIRFADANTLMNANNDARNNQMTMERGKNNYEFKTGSAVSDASNVPVSADRTSANPFAAYSRLAARNGGVFKAVWQNSDHTLITPGMNTKIVYSDHDAIKTIFGVIHMVGNIAQRYTGVGNGRFNNQTVIHMFVNSQVEPISQA